MENIKPSRFKSYLSENRSYITGGIRTGLFAFVLSYAISIVIATLSVLLFWDSVSTITEGNIGGSGELILVTIIKMTTLILNMSVFNSIGIYKIGILIMSLIAMIPFAIANHSFNKKNQLSVNHIYVYLTGSVVYALLLSIMSFIGKGKLLGFDINFLSVKNFILTIIVSIIFQLLIGMNYQKEVATSVKATRVMIRVFLGAAAIMGLISLIILLKDYTVNVLYKIIAIIVLLPNILVYRSLLFLGIDLEASETVSKAFNMIGFKTTIADYPVWMVIGSIALFIGMTVFACMYIDKEKYFKESILFSVYFSITCVLITYATSINLGEIPFFSFVSLGVNYVKVFLIPLIIINVVSVIIYLIRRIKTLVLKETN